MNPYETLQASDNAGFRGEIPHTVEEEWALDDEQERLRTRHDSASQQPYQLVGTSMIENITTYLPAVPVPLPYPVIIPQRRPGQRVRGFVRAYAPDLMRCGIDQSTFMAFLDELDRATAASPWISAVNLGSGMAGLIPSAIAPPIGLAVQITAKVYQEMQSRKNQNSFLLKMNDEFFRPRGLYCFIMAYNPNSSSTLLQQDLNAEVSSRATASKYRGNDGTTGPVEFPASAELIFPYLEDTSSDEDRGENNAKSGFSKAFDAFKEHRDLKAQRKYQRKNPSSILNPLLDPKVELRPKDHRKQEKRLEKDERKREKFERKQEKRARKHPEKGLKEPRKKLLRKDILYMMIINMPSVHEMEEAVRVVGKS
ncbi:uncharacterized protein F4812DRAFT_44999 [Daldinia caldariorum]|uniref:uncharacterized protein n=1 Tax=Daldinia caldariorum TaxID=326644 RepID=UPI00200745B7|nr:uncharacterized protein F4812DRAFT_44999 [Daldinia caldariorum]KAI1473276.1 hypothetical protein F4812DRAFT_44999 [Daldinia caldariorum]